MKIAAINILFHRIRYLLICFIYQKIFVLRNKNIFIFFFLKTEVTLNFAFKIKDISAAQIQKKMEENPKGKDPEIFGLAIIYFDFRKIHFYQN